MIISANDLVVRDFLRYAEEFKQEDSDFVYIIVDLEDKLGPKPWEWILPNGTATSVRSDKYLCKSFLYRIRI